MLEEEMVVDVDSYDKLPFRAKYELGHIHEKGVCIKNRYGPPCGVDNGS